MTVRSWLRPARHQAAIFLLLTLVPSLLLIAFGWRLLQQDHTLELQQAADAREQAADVIVAALEQQVAATEAALRGGHARETIGAHADSAALFISGGGIRVEPANRVLFYPVALAGEAAPAQAFDAGERLEFMHGDRAGAARLYRQAAASRVAAMRAGALIRLARVLRRMQSTQAALDAYAQAAAIRGAAVSGMPADLLARWARCDLLERTNQLPRLREEAGRLVDDLLTPRWVLDRAQFDAHIGDAMRWSGRMDALSSVRDRQALSQAIASLHQRHGQLSSSAEFAGRAGVEHHGVRHTLIWQGTAERATAIAAGDAFVGRQWLARLAPLEARYGVRARLDAARPGAGPTRTAAATGLPWPLTIEASDPRVPGLFAGRRALWLAGLGCLLLVIASGTYVVGRAVSRELAVARLQSDFVAAVSHEFRTPLTSLRQLTEMLTDREPDAARAHTYYETLARQTDRLHRLVENLLDFGRMEAGTSPYRLEPVDPCALTAGLARQFEADTAARAHRVHFDGDRGAGCVLADGDALARALWNLLDNAAKYSPHAGDIWVDVARDRTFVRIRVRDAGLGIPAAEQREIFAKFVRGATAKAENISGTGIGLAMVRHIASAHGGSIEVTSAPGAGSTFTLRLPLAAGVRAPGEEAACLES